MKELVVLSGKGGTGKTSLVASLAALLRPAVLVDCDVDAADLHLVLQPQIASRESFTGGSKARVLAERCTRCGRCVELCRFEAIHADGPAGPLTDTTMRIDRLACEGCGVCADHCPAGAILFEPVVAGEWFVSQTRCGPMVHARLGVGAENSGKLVTQVRRTAQQVAAEKAMELVLCDGSPGIGCPVIASLTGASMVLFVVEPTPSGLHDFQRVAELAERLVVPGLLVVNKADLHPELAGRLRNAAITRGVAWLGDIPYDPEVTRAQIAGQSVVECSSGPASRAIREIATRVEESLQSAQPVAGPLGPLRIR